MGISFLKHDLTKKIFIEKDHLKFYPNNCFEVLMFLENNLTSIIIK